MDWDELPDDVDPLIEDLCQAFLEVGLSHLGDELINADKNEKTDILIVVAIEFLAKLLTSHQVQNPLMEVNMKLEEVIEELELRSRKSSVITSKLIN